MSYIYLDESGDLGFDFTKNNTSKHFVITLMFVENKRPLEKAVVKTIMELAKKGKGKFHGTLHAANDNPAIKKKLLRMLSEKDIKVITICLHKENVIPELRGQKHKLYNYVTRILLDRVFKKKLIPTTEPIHVIASRRETKSILNENFKSYIAKRAKTDHAINLSIHVKTPYEEKCLQAVDYICWSIFRNIEIADRTYYEIIKSKIVEENPLFKRTKPYAHNKGTIRNPTHKALLVDVNIANDSLSVKGKNEENI